LVVAGVSSCGVRQEKPLRVQPGQRGRTNFAKELWFFALVSLQVYTRRLTQQLVGRPLMTKLLDREGSETETPSVVSVRTTFLYDT
jgi:hypothetical protein